MAFGSRTGIRGDGEDQGDATRVLTVSLSQPRPSIGPGPTTACEPTSPSVETPSVSPYPGKALWHEGQGQGQGQGGAGAGAGRNASTNQEKGKEETSS